MNVWHQILTALRVREPRDLAGEANPKIRELVARQHAAINRLQPLMGDPDAMRRAMLRRERELYGRLADDD